MPGPLTKLRRRAEKSAAGTQPPAGIETVPPGPHRATPREKLALRRRLRGLRGARQRLIFELGALTFEQYRRNRPDGALLGRKASEAVAVDAELEAVAGALGALPARITRSADAAALPPDANAARHLHDRLALMRADLVFAGRREAALLLDRPNAGNEPLAALAGALARRTGGA